MKPKELTINGRKFLQWKSPNGVMIERDGELYSEAIDHAEFDRQYTETDIPIEGVEE